MTSSSPSAAIDAVPDPAARSARRVLWVSCTAHALHDGYTDMIYVLLPVWQAEFGLGYAAVAMLRGLYAGTMACLQLPAGRLARHLGAGVVLALGTLLASAGYVAAGFSGGIVGLCAALALSGAGSSTQHPLASGAVSRAYGTKARGPLSLYNFSGDLGKAALPAALSLLVTAMPWRHALWALSAIGVAVALALLRGLPSGAPAPATAGHAEGHVAEADAAPPQSARGRHFELLVAVGVLDTGVRMGVLTFLPFLLLEKGATAPTLGPALAMVFIGGAAGKMVCGWLGTRLGVVGTVFATEGATAACILALLAAPLVPALVLLPLLGVMLNGTSSVLYGTVPELATHTSVERAFAVFYTGTIAAGAVGPIVYGALGDAIGIHGATWATAVTALATLPLAWLLRERLATPAPA